MIGGVSVCGHSLLWTSKSPSDTSKPPLTAPHYHPRLAHHLPPPPLIDPHHHRRQKQRHPPPPPPPPTPLRPRKRLPQRPHRIIHQLPTTPHLPHPLHRLSIKLITPSLHKPVQKHKLIFTRQPLELPVQLHRKDHNLVQAFSACRSIAGSHPAKVRGCEKVLELVYCSGDGSGTGLLEGGVLG